MRRFLLISTGLLLGLNSSVAPANGQWMYPGGYGGYGYSRWGADPGAGYMAGLGAYARGKGVYEEQKAKADAINLDTMIKWNKALRARQAALRADQQKEAAQREAEREARVQQRELEDGTTLNRFLAEIYDEDPGVSSSIRDKIPISTSAIREIPFEWDTEAVTLCIDQMTASDALPPPLAKPEFADERNSLHSAVTTALKEDASGSVSPKTLEMVHEAIAGFRSRFLKTSSDFELGHQDALDYFTTMAGLSRLLHDPSMKAFLKQLKSDEDLIIGDLIAFMNAYNLRFGPATTDRQIDIYKNLAVDMARVRDAHRRDDLSPSTPDESGRGLRDAARSAFKGMSWDQLEAHRRQKGD